MGFLSRFPWTGHCTGESDFHYLELEKEILQFKWTGHGITGAIFDSGEKMRAQKFYHNIKTK